MLKIAWSPVYKYPLPEGHRFPMEKYELLPEQLLYEGTVEAANFFEPEPVSEEVILLTHAASYWERLKNLQLSPKEVRAIGFPMSELLVNRTRHIANGTIQAALYARQNGIGMNAAGGTHHSFSYKGEGFCLLNDAAVAANYLLHQNFVDKVLIIDLDVHQGNGTAEIFKNEARVFTFSMHGEKNYPARKEHSSLDIGLPDGTEDREYLKILRNTLPVLMESVEPGLVFYNAGVDVLETDKLGRLSLSMQGCKERDRIVLETCKRYKIPLTINMGGGYNQRLSNLIEAHANTYRLAQELFF